MRFPDRLLAPVLAAGMLLSACGPGEDGTVLRLSGWSSSPEETRLIETQLAEFRRLHPGIRVKYEPIVGDYMQKLQVLFASGTEPDVFYLDSKEIGRMSHFGVLEPLDAHLEAVGEDLTDFYENLIRTFRGADGRLYGLPKGFSTLALYYNLEVFKDAGIKTPPRTWDELLAASKEIRARGTVPLCMLGDMKTLHLFAGLAGGEILEGDSILRFQSPKAKKGIGVLLDLFGESGLARTPQDFGGSWTGDAFAKKQAAMIIEGMWVAPYLKMRSPDMRYGVAPVPTMERRYNLIFTVAYVLSSRSKHKKEAVELARYLTGKKGLAHLAELGLEIPSRKSVVEKDFLKRFPERRPFIDGVKNAVSFKYGAQGDRVAEELSKAFEAARLKQMPLDAALDRAARKLDRFYEVEP